MSHNHSHSHHGHGHSHGPAPDPHAAHPYEIPPCYHDLEELVARYPGVQCVSVPATGEFDIEYNARAMGEDDVREFAGKLGRAWSGHMARCTIPLHGRACESCALRIGNRVQKLFGVRNASASFINGSLSVVFDSSDTSLAGLIESIRKEGVPVRIRRRFVPGWKKLLATLDGVRSQTVLVALAGAAIVAGFAAQRWAPESGAAWLAWAVAYLAGGYSGVRAALHSLRQGTIDIDLLMVLAAIGAACIGAPAEGAVLLFLFALSNLLQDYATGRSRRAIAALLDLRPPVALVKDGDAFISTPVEQVQVGQTIVLKPGERVPLDGDVISGAGSIDQASVTGESVPVEKGPGDAVFAGTINQEGSLEVRVTRAAAESTLARMISLVEAAQSEKARTQNFLERAEQYYALGVIALTALLIVVPWLVMGAEFQSAFYRAMTVMVVASPCALVLSTPAAILSAIAGLGRKGLLVKGGRHLEDAARIRAVALDKTGTLTVGKPSVTDVALVAPEAADLTEDDLLRMAAEAEFHSEHPLARAVITLAEQRGIGVTAPQAFSSITGRGGEATLQGGEHIVFGSLKLMEERGAAGYGEAETIVRGLEADGKTVICVARQHEGGAQVLGVLGLQDVLRRDALQALAALRDMGITRIAMLTGDSQGVAQAIAKQAGIAEVYAGLMPEDKVRIVKEMSATTPVLMVGDGVNDAPALAAADLGMAMGAAGTDVAMETSDVVLMAHEIEKLPYFLMVSRKAQRVVAQNLVFSMAVVVVLLVAALGFHLPLTLGVLGHEGSTLIVCANGLRLLRPVKGIRW